MNIRNPLCAALDAWLILLSTPALAAFTDNNDGTVTDGVTGLMWDKCSWGTATSPIAAAAPPAPTHG